MSDDDADFVRLKIRDPTGEYLRFRVRRSTPMSRLIQAYSSRVGLAPSAVKFIVDGERVKPSDMVEDYDLEDEDQIDAHLEQTGGSGNSDSNDHLPPHQSENTESAAPAATTTTAAPTAAEETMTLLVREQNGSEIAFRVRPSTKLGKIFTVFAERKSVPLDSLRFLSDGQRLKPDDTPKMLELNSEDVIEVLQEQVGGC